MITVERFLECVKQNADRIHGYEKGHDGSDGTCDCVGLIIGALRLAGIDYKGIHGSNYFERYCTAHTRSVGDLKLGDLVYKAKNPGEDGYDLPDRYKNGSDLKDYYHIGVVMNLNPLNIWHCSGGGMHYDTKIGKWNYCGECTYVEYEEKEPMNPPYIAKVNVSSGSLNIRSGPGVEYAKIGSVPKDAEVTVVTHGEEWDFIKYERLQGYVSNRYLLPIREIHDDDEPENVITIPKADAEKYIEMLKELIKALGG